MAEPSPTTLPAFQQAHEDQDVNKLLPSKVILPGEIIHELSLNIVQVLLFLPSSTSFIQSALGYVNFLCSFYATKTKDRLPKKK